MNLVAGGSFTSITLSEMIEGLLEAKHGLHSYHSDCKRPSWLQEAQDPTRLPWHLLGICSLGVRGTVGKRLLKQEIRSSFEVIAGEIAHRQPHRVHGHECPGCTPKSRGFLSKAFEAELAISQLCQLRRVRFSRLADTSGIFLIPVCADPNPPL